MTLCCLSLFSSHPIMVAAFDCNFSFFIDEESVLLCTVGTVRTTGDSHLYTSINKNINNKRLYPTGTTDTTTAYHCFYGLQHHQQSVILNNAYYNCFNIGDTPVFQTSKMISDNTTIATMVANRYQSHLSHHSLLASVDVQKSLKWNCPL